MRQPGTFGAGSPPERPRTFKIRPSNPIYTEAPAFLSNGSMVSPEACGYRSVFAGPARLGKSLED
jgi:hypothetical protein